MKHQDTLVLAQQFIKDCLKVGRSKEEISVLVYAKFFGLKDFDLIDKMIEEAVE